MINNFIAYTSLCAKYMQAFYKQNTWKIRNCLCKMENSIKFNSMKGLFASIKGELCLKRALGLSRRVHGGWFPLIRSCFWHFWFKWRKSFFFFFFFWKKNILYEASNPWTLYLYIYLAYCYSKDKTMSQTNSKITLSNSLLMHTWVL